MLIEIMHALSSALQTPVIIVLLVLVVTVIVIVGMLIAELFTERRYFRLSVPTLVDELQTRGDYRRTILESDMLGRQKKALLELLSHPDATPIERESMAVNIVAQEQALYDNRIKITDLISKIAPMFGLMGTLIPLGPGIVAIGEGETEILAESLLIAFDTTVLGLIVAAVALVVSAIRKSWYAKYTSAFEAACECVLDAANSERSDAEGSLSMVAARAVALEEPTGAIAMADSEGGAYVASAERGVA